MSDAVCRMLTLLCTLVVVCPIGTNLGLLHLLWMLASGRLLGARGALFPGLADCGLSAYPCHARHTHDPCRSSLSYRRREG